MGFEGHGCPDPPEWRTSSSCCASRTGGPWPGRDGRRPAPKCLDVLLGRQPTPSSSDGAEKPRARPADRAPEGPRPRTPQRLTRPWPVTAARAAPPLPDVVADALGAGPRGAACRAFTLGEDTLMAGGAPPTWSSPLLPTWARSCSPAPKEGPRRGLRRAASWTWWVTRRGGGRCRSAGGADLGAPTSPPPEVAEAAAHGEAEVAVTGGRPPVVASEAGPITSRARGPRCGSTPSAWTSFMQPDGRSWFVQRTAGRGPRRPRPKCPALSQAMQDLTRCSHAPGRAIVMQVRMIPRRGRLPTLSRAFVRDPVEQARQAGPSSSSSGRTPSSTAPSSTRSATRSCHLVRNAPRPRASRRPARPRGPPASRRSAR